MSEMPGPDDPAFTDAWQARIEHDRERAVAELEALVAARPGSAPAWAMLMLAHHRRLDFAAGTLAAQALLALEPDHPHGLQQLAFNLAACGDYEAAVAAYRRAHAVTRSPLSAYMVALLLHRLGRRDEAAQAYGAILAASDMAGLEVLGILRGVMNLLRDQGQPLAADRFAHMLNLRYRQNPVQVSSFLVDRDQSSPFHEWLGLVDKTTLGEVLARGMAAEPGVARVPESFNLPTDREALLRFAAGTPDALYIVKPARGSGGQGIHVTGDVTTLAGLTDVVVQRYIADPWLIEGRKGHLRIYALITQAQPLRAWIYREGIVRIAPEPYDLAPERLADVAMHVTNTALHLDHPGLVISQDETRDDEGAIRSLSAVLRRMAAEGFDPEAVFGEISDLVAWFLRQLQREGFFARQSALGSPRSFGPKLIGFDILLDAGGHPWLIELQSNPAARGAPLVNKINSELFNNIFRMSVGVLAEDKISDTDLAGLRSDPGALAAAERAHEASRRALFSPLRV